MSDSGYLIWFIATAIMTVVVMGTCIAGAAGVFSKRSRDRRHLLKEEAARVEVPRQRRGSGRAGSPADRRPSDASR